MIELSSGEITGSRTIAMGRSGVAPGSRMAAASPTATRIGADSGRARFGTDRRAMPPRGKAVWFAHQLSRRTVAGSCSRCPATVPGCSTSRAGSMERVLDDTSAEEFTWAPDGRRVAFHSRRSGEWGLWMMAAR